MISWDAGHCVRLMTLSRARCHSTKESFSPLKLPTFPVTHFPRAVVTVTTERAHLPLLHARTEPRSYVHTGKWQGELRTRSDLTRLKSPKYPTSSATSLIHSVFCLTTGPMPPPKRFLHIVRSRASSFK